MLTRSASECFVICFALTFTLLLPLGTFLNWLVMNANGGKMPVATEVSQVFLWIGTRKEDFPTETDNYQGDARHGAFTDNSRYPLLADRIAIRLPDLSFLPSPILQYLNYKGYPTNSREILMSWGDAGIFIHAWLAPISLLLLLPYGLRDIRKKIEKKKKPPE